MVSKYKEIVSLINYIPKPQKIADLNFLEFKGLAAIKIRILWRPQYSR
ncbi:MAG: hypothetical protein LBS83_03145 [Holosporales bacterium]|nr:hypothetical protein [Holosporales bacterium]